MRVACLCICATVRVPGRIDIEARLAHERRPQQQGPKSEKPQVRFELYEDLPSDVIAQSREIVREARLDIGGIEYVETADGERYFYDINASSVYRDDIVQAAGLDAADILGRYIEREYRKERRKSERGEQSLRGSRVSTQTNTTTNQEKSYVG